MMNKKNKGGSGLSQYSIIIVLIALALVPVFILSGKLIQDNFANFNNIFQAHTQHLSDDRTINTAVLNETAKAGDLKGTRDNPKLICFKSKCSIDYGEFILNGLPENFGEHVQASGNSGGSDTVAALLKQIADYLNDKGKSSEAAQVLKLSNLSHNIAAVERNFEGKIKACGNNDACLRALENTSIGNIAGFDYNLTGFDPNMTYRDMVMNIGLGQAYEHLYGEDKEPGIDATKEAVLTFKDIKENATLDPLVKGIVEELYWDIGVMSERVGSLGYQMVTDFNDTEPHNAFDPLTGEKFNPKYDNGYDTFVNDNAPQITDFNSALICISGKAKDSGKKCHK